MRFELLRLRILRKTRFRPRELLLVVLKRYFLGEPSFQYLRRRV